MAAAYQDSGSDWIGPVPNDWSMSKIHVDYSVKLGKMVESERESIASSLHPYLCAANIKWSGIDTSVQKEMYFTPAELRDNLVKDGDALITEGGSIGTTCIYHGEFGECGIQNSVLRARGKTKAHTRFLYYWLSLVEGSGYLDSICNRATIAHYTKEKVDRTPIVRIPDDELLEVVRLLDDETMQYDKAMGILEEQIEVLGNYRKSLIQETVTRGLDPNAEMKPTGYEYIGDIPSAWALSPLLYLGAMQNGISKDGDSFGSGYPFVSYGDVYRNVFLPHSVEGLVESNSEERYRYSVKKNDAFFTRTSETIDEIGFASVCKKTIENATFAGFLIRFRPTSDQLNMRYAAYYFRSENLRAYFAREMVSVTRASLSQNLLGRLVVPLPPLDEQERIANYLDEKCSTVERLIAGKRKQLETLRAQRQSIIYEYVTGKRRVV